MMTTRAVLYARVSSDDTRNEGRNLKGQLDMCREYALSKGWQVVAELAEDDRGASGASLDLPQLNHMLDMAKAGEFDVVVVREIDRFSRRLAKQLIVEEELKRCGVRIEYTMGEYPDTPEGNLMKNVKASIAEYEREKIAQRMTRGRRQIVKGGSIMLHGDRPPYGYRVSPDGRNLVIHEPEARIIRQIYAWYVEGDENGEKLGTRAIAKRLSKMQVPTWEDIHQRNSKKRGHGKWSAGVIGRILTRETYAGRWHYGCRSNNRPTPRSYWLTVEVPAIVDQEMWDKAQVQRERNIDTAKRNGCHEYLLARRVTCGQCGYKMRVRSTWSKGKQYKYYRCSSRFLDVALVDDCDNVNFRANEVDRLVWQWVRSLLSDPLALETGLESYQAEQEQAVRPARDRLAITEKLVAESRHQLDRLIDLYLTEDFPKEMLLERKNRLEGTLAALEEERAALTAQVEAQTLTQDQIKNVKRFAKRVGAGLERADVDFAMRRQIIEELDVRATLTLEDGEKVVYARCVLGMEAFSLDEGGTNGLRGGGLSIATITPRR